MDAIGHFQKMGILPSRKSPSNLAIMARSVGRCLGFCVVLFCCFALASCPFASPFNNEDKDRFRHCRPIASRITHQKETAHIDGVSVEKREVHFATASQTIMFPDDFHIFLFVCGKLACEREKRKEFWVNIDAKTDSCAKQAANNNQNIEEEKYQTIIIIIKEIEKKSPSPLTKCKWVSAGRLKKRTLEDRKKKDSPPLHFGSPERGAEFASARSSRVLMLLMVWRPWIFASFSFFFFFSFLFL